MNEENRFRSLKEREFFAEHHLRWKIILKVWLIVGTLFFILSGGFPWSSSGIMDAVMGRRGPFPFWERVALHYAMAFVDTAALAFVIYRFKPLMGILLGVVFGMTVLYGLNFLIFRIGFGLDGSSEPDAFLTHLVFSSVTSAIYKGMAIPRVKTKTPESPKHLKHA
jgi:hypothetical protein